MDNITPQIHESIIEHKGKFGMVTFNRRIIMPENDIIEFDADNLMLPALKEGKWGLVSQTEDGKELTSFKYDGIAFLGMFNGFEAMRNGEKIHLSISGEEDGESAVVINDFM